MSSTTPPTVQQLLQLPDGKKDRRWCVYLLILTRQRGREGLGCHLYTGSPTAATVFNDKLQVVTAGEGRRGSRRTWLPPQLEGSE